MPKRSSELLRDTERKMLLNLEISAKIVADGSYKYFRKILPSFALIH